MIYLCSGGMDKSSKTIQYISVLIYIENLPLDVPLSTSPKMGRAQSYRLFTFSGGTFLRGVQGNPNYFPILVQGDAVHGIGSN